MDVLRTAEEETHGWKMLIGGKWEESRSGRRMASINPGRSRKSRRETPRTSAAVAGMNFTVSAGQSCGSNSRVFVHRRIHDRFVEAVIARANQIRIGLPELEDTQVGPVVSRRQFERVTRFIEAGKNEGARMVRGGGNVPQHGFFVDITIFDGVTHGMAIEREEIFGPVMGILAWDDEGEMLPMRSRPAMCGSTATATSATRARRSGASRIAAWGASIRWASS